MANFKALPPIEQLAERLAVDPTSPSGLRWKVNRPHVKSGDAAGSIQKSGYWYVSFSPRLIPTHRVVYALVHGVDPANMDIDHIDRNKSNNDINNLRLVDRSTNKFNSNIYKNNKTGVKGVSWNRFRAKYCAHIQVQSIFYNLGCFDTLEEAIEARRDAELRFGATGPLL